MKWINVKDKLPEEEDAYLVIVKLEEGAEVTVLYYTKEHQFGYMPVTHWMKMPELPE